MQVITLLIVAMVYLSEEATRWSPWTSGLGSDQRVVLSFAGPAAIVALTAGIFALCRRRIDRRGSWRSIAIAERTLAASAWLALLVHVFNLAVLDLHGAVRSELGDWIIVDEFIALSPPVLVVLGAWFFYYPINRRLREAALIRLLDSGKPVYPIWTRREYVLSQARLHFGLVLLPALIIMGWAEAVEIIWNAERDGAEPTWIPTAALGIGVAAIFLFAPTLMTRIWDTTPLRSGELRDRLERLCHVHGVRVRKLLVWNTHGAMINGAVMGLIGRLRYILLTDALLDTMTTTQVEAVMAHELGHARRHHLPWLAICLIATISTTGLVTGLLVRAATPPVGIAQPGIDAGPTWQAPSMEPLSSPPASLPISRSAPSADWIEPLALVATLVISLGAFGWTSRRFERQADTFAVQHLSGLTRDGGDDAVITHEAADAMSDALQVVAELNHIPTSRRSWRHGSIAWRQNYLRSIVGTRCDALGIDRVMRRIQVIAVLALLTSATLTWWFDGLG